MTGVQILDGCLSDGRRKGPQHQKQFATETASASGMSRSAIYQELKRADELKVDVSRIVGTSLDKGVEMDALIKLPEPERKELIERAIAGEAVLVSGKEYSLVVIEAGGSRTCDSFFGHISDARQPMRFGAFDTQCAGSGVYSAFGAVASAILTLAFIFFNLQKLKVATPLPLLFRDFEVHPLAKVGGLLVQSQVGAVEILTDLPLAGCYFSSRHTGRLIVSIRTSRLTIPLPSAGGSSRRMSTRPVPSHFVQRQL